MRLRLFDRIRRLARPRRSEAAKNQGKHRKDQRQVAPYDPPPESQGPRRVARSRAVFGS